MTAVPHGRPALASFTLALGGGGARGLAHVGVLRVLEREGLRPVAIAGTSMGAIVGALYAAGTAPDELVGVLDLLEVKGLVGVTKLNLRPGSLLSADAFEARMRDVLPATFAELALPFAAVAVDLITGRRIVISEGDLPLAVRASMSMPIVFEPVRMGEWMLVDGGIIDPVPVDAARQLARVPVIAVDVGPLEPPAPRPGDFRGTKPTLNVDAPTTAQVGTRAYDVAAHWLARPGLLEAAKVIAPEVGGYGMADFLEGAEIVLRGEHAAEVAVPEVRAALEEAARPLLARWWRRATGVSAGR